MNSDSVIWPFLIVIIVIIIWLLVTNFAVYGDKRECGNLTWNSEGHEDHNAKDKLKSDSYNKDICEVSKDVDHMKTKGEIKDWTQFKTSKVYATATHEQRECLKEGFDSPDNGDKALQAYELSYCGYDDD